MLILHEKLAQELLDYLATKPYVEVYVLINQLQQLKKIEDKENGH